MNELENEPNTKTDPLAPCLRAGYIDLLVRLALALGLALMCFHELDFLASSVIFLYAFLFLPRFTSPDLTLKSGRTIKQLSIKLTTCLHGKNRGKRMLDVNYTCCANDSQAPELQQEFDEMCLAVFASCDRRKLIAAELTALLPKKPVFFGLTLLPLTARSSEFEKDEDTWKEIEIRRLS